MTQILMEVAEATAQRKMVLTLEGGYDVVGQSRSVRAVLKELAGLSSLEKKDLLEKEESNYSRIEKVVLQIKSIQKRYWKSL